MRIQVASDLHLEGCPGHLPGEAAFRPVREIGPTAWISGYTHEAYDYQEGPTRCIGNPAGYLGEERQSGLFRPDRIVEVRLHSPESVPPPDGAKRSPLAYRKGR